MNETKNKLARKEVLARVRKALAPRYDQIPQLECEATKRKAPVA
jgi:hypothetical protein